MQAKWLLAAGLAAAPFMAGCAVRIGQINADPSRYRDRTVTVDGTVVNSVGLLGKGAYRVEDGTGAITVLSSKGIPAGGSRVSVTGNVIPGGMMLGLPVGTAMRERSHHVK
jgi:hypothetical protein